MMNLDEAIKHCEEVADEKEEDAILYHNCATYNQNLYEKGLAENTEKECRACAEEHRQIAEWLKELKELRVRYNQLRRDCNETIDVIGKLRDELKAYKEQDSVAISNLAMCHILNHEVKWINERMTREGVGRMNESEKERLIKKDIESIENRVRHAFNQGYELGLKERAKNEDRR